MHFSAFRDGILPLSYNESYSLHNVKLDWPSQREDITRKGMGAKLAEANLLRYVIRTTNVEFLYTVHSNVTRSL